MQAIQEMNNTIMFGHQIKVEQASIGMLDLPQGILKQINDKLPLQDEKHFREVCLGCPVLRQAYKDEIGESAIIKVNLRNQDLCHKFLNEFNIIVNSRLKISLTLPNIILQKFNVSFIESYNLRTKLIELIDFCDERIEQIDIVGDKVAATDMLCYGMLILPRLTQLKKIKIDLLGSMIDRDSEIFQQLINNNCVSVEYLELCGITFNNDAIFNQMLNLTEIKLYECEGDIGLQSLLSKASNVTNAVIRKAKN